LKQNGELRVLRSGPDWATFSVHADPHPIDFGSLRVLFDLVTVEFGDRFHDAQSTHATWWRWCSRRAVLTIHNRTTHARKVAVSMLIHAEGDAPVRIRGTLLQAKTSPGMGPVRFEREVTVEPGAHTLTLSTENCSIAGQPDDPRKRYFRVVRPKVQDPGAPSGDDTNGSSRLAGQKAGNSTLR
jgi:hypothetical protein